MILATPILIICAAVFKAFADTVDHHFDTSVFRRLNPKFWDRDISSTKARKVFGYKLDAWHISMSCMVVSMILAAIFHMPAYPWYMELMIGAVLWNGPFNICYNHIFWNRRKYYRTHQ